MNDELINRHRQTERVPLQKELNLTKLAKRLFGFGKVGPYPQSVLDYLVSRHVAVVGAAPQRPDGDGCISRVVTLSTSARRARGMQ